MSTHADEPFSVLLQSGSVTYQATRELVDDGLLWTCGAAPTANGAGHQGNTGGGMGHQGNTGGGMGHQGNTGGGMGHQGNTGGGMGHQAAGGRVVAAVEHFETAIAALAKDYPEDGQVAPPVSAILNGLSGLRRG